MDFTLIAIQISSLLIGFSLHEAGHAYCAKFLGDNTSERLGRLTLNPIKHLDPFGSVILPLLLILAGSPFIFAAAKPVPVNPSNFKRPITDFAIVALAGPMVNILLAIVAAFAFRFVSMEDNGLVITFILMFIWINMVLAFFNLLPIPPLDGSKIIAGIMPKDMAIQWLQLERMGFIFLLIFIVGSSFLPISPILVWIEFLERALTPILNSVSGIDIDFLLKLITGRIEPPLN